MTQKIDWTHAPEWATHVAMDKNGQWHWYNQEPFANTIYVEHQWFFRVSSQHTKYEKAPDFGCDVYWSETLATRPVDTEMVVDWDNIETHMKFVARDDSGSFWAYKSMPGINHELKMWCNTGGGMYMCSPVTMNCSGGPVDWTKAIQERPVVEVKPEPVKKAEDHYGEFEVIVTKPRADGTFVEIRGTVTSSKAAVAIAKQFERELKTVV